jgi:hypothetical protein
MAGMVLPPLHDAASDASLRGQDRFVRATQGQLVCLIVAAVGGALVLEAGDVSIGAVVALIAFVAALGLRTLMLIAAPARNWYEGRAAAESVKTLAWRYAVGGHPFAVGLGEPEADQLFVERCSEILRELTQLELVVEAGPQITPQMRDLRQGPLAVRKDAYETARIADQQDWYSAKCAANRQKAWRWQLALGVLETVGVLAAVARVAGWIHFDLLGVMAASTAAGTAWIQTRQYEQLAAAYGIACQELANVRALVHSPDNEGSWAVFVQDAEEAISREHTMWRASHGVRLKP